MRHISRLLSAPLRRVIQRGYCESRNARRIGFGKARGRVVKAA